jgi:hypothetical protein
MFVRNPYNIICIHEIKKIEGKGKEWIPDNNEANYFQGVILPLSLSN